MDFLWGLLIGVVAGLIMIPIGIKITKKIKDVKERRYIKVSLYNNQFLKPLDKRDFDTNMWKDKIDIKKLVNNPYNLQNTIFKKKINDVKSEKEVINDAKE